MINYFVKVLLIFFILSLLLSIFSLFNITLPLIINNVIAITASVIMLFAGILYIYGGFTDKHKGLIGGGIVYLVGAYFVFQQMILWPYSISFLIALFLNRLDADDPN